MAEAEHIRLSVRFRVELPDVFGQGAYGYFGLFHGYLFCSV
jgi:hypothetical protein